MQSSNLQIDMKRTGRKIKALCKARNITVKDIQRELCIGAFQSVYDWFSGKSLPSLDNFFRLSKLLNVYMEDMIEVISEPVFFDLQYSDRNAVKLNLAVFYERLKNYMKMIQLQTE